MAHPPVEASFCASPALQTTQSSGVSGEQALAEVLHMTKEIFGVVGQGMEEAAARELGEQRRRQARSTHARVFC